MRSEIVLLGDAEQFIDTLDAKTRTKVLYNIKKSQHIQDSNLFKKLNKYIWEFRTRHNRQTIRLLAFWAKDEREARLVVCTHGFTKKTAQTPKQELRRAEKIRREYLNH